MFNWFKKKKKPIQQAKNRHVITMAEVFKTLVDYWPKINPRDIKLADGMYVCPTRAEVEKTLFDSKIDEMIYIAEINDCDNFAVLLYAYVLRKRYEDYNAGLTLKGGLYSLTVGEMWYENPIAGPHAINIAITSDAGILFIEPQTDRVWKAEKSAVVSFIRI